ncbi:MAG: hypothetical protein JJT85_12765 [Chromatiales bacterium]|nr:hypothetical protein [Chromatiales bacterium]
MNDDTDGLSGLDDEVVAEDDGDEEADEVEVDADSDDPIGEDSVEINVEDLIARIESDAGGGPTMSARRKLEQYMEERRTFRDIMDFEDYDLED